MTTKIPKDRNFILFIIGAIVTVAIIAIYPQIVSQKQDQVLYNQEELIKKINENGNNRTKQLKELVNEVNDNMTMEIQDNRAFLLNLTKIIMKDLSEHEQLDDNRFSDYSNLSIYKSLID